MPNVTVKDATTFASELSTIPNDDHKEHAIAMWGKSVARDQRYLCIENLQGFLTEQPEISRELAYQILSRIQNTNSPV
jgi:hypothetical protein